MKELVEGHVYDLMNQNGDGVTTLTFYMDPDIPHTGQVVGKYMAGTTNQEVMRALIFRIKALNDEKQWGGNSIMINHLRECIILHEVRAAARKGLCTLAVSNTLDWWNKSKGIECIPPRPSDSHIYPMEVHSAAECGGRC